MRTAASSVASAAAGSRTRGGGLISHIAQSFPPTLQAPAHAREGIRNACSHWPTPDLEIALLITSELVTNAVLHGAGDIGIVVTCQRNRLRVAVSDSGVLAAIEPRAAENPFAEAGRGLTLVGLLSDAWGVEESKAHPGKTVWFELSAKAAPTTPVP